MGDSAIHVAGQVRLAVGRISRQLRRLYGQSRRTDEPSFLELAILQRLERVGAVSVSELASGERVTTQAVSAVVAGLQQRELVETSTDPADRRRTLVRVNDVARALLLEREERVTARLGEVITAQCTPEELRLLSDAAVVLDRIATHL